VILFFVILILSIVIHEYAHGYAAYKLGDPTAKNMGRLTLNPIAHIDIFGSILVPLLMYLTTGFVFGWAKPVPYNPYFLRNQKYGPALVAVAGPSANLVTALVFGILFRFLALEGFTLIVLINIILAVFNLVPIPPLDGSKILFAFIPDRYNHIKIVFERFGFMLLLFFIFFAFNLIRPIINFLYNLILFG
ncbi:MAG: site-2 protease family protein, partial [bacterium]